MNLAAILLAELQKIVDATQSTIPAEESADKASSIALAALQTYAGGKSSDQIRKDATDNAQSIAVWHTRRPDQKEAKPPLAIFTHKEAAVWFGRKGVPFNDVLLDLKMEGLCTRIVGYIIEWEPANGFLEKR